MSRDGYCRRSWDGDGSECVLNIPCPSQSSGDTKAIAGTEDDGQRRRRGLGARPWVQFSPPGPGSAGLRRAPDCRRRPGWERKRWEGRGEGERAEPPPRPRRDPQPETQQGPYAMVPPRGLEKGTGRSGRPAVTGKATWEMAAGPATAALRAQARPPIAQSGRASSAAAAPFLLIGGAQGPAPGLARRRGGSWRSWPKGAVGSPPDP